MDCNTARSLLPYLHSAADLGAEDRAELEHHLATCSACAAAAGADRLFDDAIGRLIREVAVPVGLRDQVVTRMAIERGQVWRKQLLRGTAAAAALLMLTIALGWWAARKVEVSVDALALAEDREMELIALPDQTGVEGYFRTRGVPIALPPGFDPGLLAGYDVVEFEGHRVGRLDFQHNEARAKVYVLSKRQFKLHKGTGLTAAGSHCSVEIAESAELFFVIVYQLDATRQQFLNRNAPVG